MISDRVCETLHAETDPERRVAGPIGCAGCESLMTKVSSADRVWNETDYDTRVRTLSGQPDKPKGFARDWLRIIPWG